jgi:hypothetical protein
MYKIWNDLSKLYSIKKEQAKRGRYVANLYSLYERLAFVSKILGKKNPPVPPIMPNVNPIEYLYDKECINGKNVWKFLLSHVVNTLEINEYVVDKLNLLPYEKYYKGSTPQRIFLTNNYPKMEKEISDVFYVSDVDVDISVKDWSDVEYIMQTLNEYNIESMLPKKLRLLGCKCTYSRDLENIGSDGKRFNLSGLKTLTRDIRLFRDLVVIRLRVPVEINGVIIKVSILDINVIM